MLVVVTRSDEVCCRTL